MIEVELPNNLTRELIKQLLQEHLPLKTKQEFRERPWEAMIFNLYTQTLADWIWNIAEKAILNNKVAKTQTKHDLVMTLMTMIVHKIGNGRIELDRVIDGDWFEQGDKQLAIVQDDSKLILTVTEGNDVD